jgi:hypothetical protein
MLNKNMYLAGPNELSDFNMSQHTRGRECEEQCVYFHNLH